MKDFVHLHLHTDYSMMDGCQRPDQMFQRLKELGMKKVAITNHGNMINMPKMIKEGNKQGVQVIPGCELYVCWDYMAHQKDDDHKKTYHMIALAKNKTGYHNLLKLTSRGFIEGKYYKPRVDKKMLEEHSEGLIILTACLNGTLANQIAKQDKEACELEDDVRWLNEIFKDNIYLEVQRHPEMPMQDKANKAVFELAKKFNVPTVATCDAHYSVPEHFEAWQTMMLLQTQMRFGHDLQNDYYIKSPEQMYELWKDVPKVCEETKRIAEKCEPIVFDTSIKYPPFDTGKLTAEEALLQSCKEGLEYRIDQGKIDPARKKEYEERFEYECKVLGEKNFSTYILIVADFTTWAKDQGIRMSPGRGSGCGSLALYLTRTTEIDPLYKDNKNDYALIFERFINPERNSFPDIDQDFQDDRRWEVIEYINQKYGKDKICKIMTIGTLAASNAIREVCRRFGVPFSATNEFAKLIPAPVRGRAVNLKKAVEIEPRFAAALEKDLPTEMNGVSGTVPARKVYNIALIMEGMAKNVGVHAAGVVISDEHSLWEHIALMIDKDGEVISADDGKVLEDQGFIKFDFLGIKTLTVIQNTINWVYENYGIEIDIDNIPINDSNVYEMIRRGDLFGVFQLGGSSGFMDVTTQMKPDSIDNISDINAVYRPGPLDNGFVPKYAQNKTRMEAGKPIEYMMKVDNKKAQEEIEKILKPTYGVCLYQEQIQFIAQKVAGYSLGKADMLRRAIGKKIPEVMEAERKAFVEGCMGNGVSSDSAEHLFDQIAKFADYCFNKSHAIAYSIIGYQTAWLKYYYPNEFMAAHLTNVKNNQDKTIQFINACREEGIDVLKPDINESYGDYTPSKNGIRFGLGAVKGLGDAAISPIMNERKKNGDYLSFYNFMKRIKKELSKIKKSDITTLVKSGAFDSCEKAS